MCLNVLTAFGGILFTQIRSASKWVADQITVCTDLGCTVKEPVLAASRQCICVASSNEQQQQQQQQHGCDDVLDSIDAVKSHAEKNKMIY